jgi:GNAT superfamily N-acetyltransferase
MSLTLRDMTAADIREGLRLSRAAGWNQSEEDWRFLLEGNPGRFVLAARDGHVVGTGGAVCYGTALAWVCMILVDPDQRKLGIGTAVVEAVLARLGDVHAVGLDATPYGQGLYARLGFVETARFVRMEAAAGALAAPRRVAHPLTPAGIDPVLARDREVFGADRGPLLRAALGRAPAFSIGHGGVLEGYCFGRRGAKARQIGPVVADDIPAARALVQTAMQAGPDDTVVVDACADVDGWPAALSTLGFREQRPLVRMFRGGAPVGRPERQLAIFGPEFG